MSRFSLKLVKLHGSVTWWKDTLTGDITEERQPPNPDYVASAPTGPLLIYPIQQKETFLPPYIDAFYALKEALASSKTWVAMGYSFEDDVIRSLFANSSRETTKLILLHPNESVKRRMG